MIGIPWFFTWCPVNRGVFLCQDYCRVMFFRVPVGVEISRVYYVSSRIQFCAIIFSSGRPTRRMVKVMNVYLFCQVCSGHVT